MLLLACLIICYQQALPATPRERADHFVSSGKSVTADIIVKAKLAATLGLGGPAKNAGQALTDHSSIRVVLSSRLPAIIAIELVMHSLTLG